MTKFSQIRWVPLVWAICACATPQGKSVRPSSDRSSPAKTGLQGDARASQQDPTKQRPTLFQRLGGLPAIEAVVADFRKNVNEDERVNAPFGLSDMDALNRHLVEFFCQATGGPCKYTGRDMVSVHKGMKITNAQFDAVVEDLVKSLDKFHVPGQEKSEILSALGPMRGQMVEE